MNTPGNAIRMPEAAPIAAAAPDALPRLDIFGVPVLAATTADAVRLIDGERREPLAVAFLNAHGSNLAARDSAFAAALRGMLVLNDGIGVEIAARLLGGRRFPDNLNGTDFVPAFLASTRHDQRIFLLGGRPGVAERAAAALATAHPRHQIVGTRHGYFDAAETQAVIDAIRAGGTTLLLVAMGNPAQELWIARHLAATGAQIGFGVGALFDFLAGDVARAPAFARRTRLEWAWRLMLEPKRLFRRYLVGNPLFLMRVVRRRLSGQGR